MGVKKNQKNSPWKKIRMKTSLVATALKTPSGGLYLIVNQGKGAIFLQMRKEKEGGEVAPWRRKFSDPTGKKKGKPRLGWGKFL